MADFKSTMRMSFSVNFSNKSEGVGKAFNLAFMLPTESGTITDWLDASFLTPTQPHRLP